MRKLILLAAATAMGGVAVPAAAQYYPPQGVPQPAPGQPGYGYYPNQGYGYPNQAYPAPGYGYPQGGIGGIIGALLGNRYAVNDRQAITQCASVASQEAARRYPARYRGNYGAPYGNAYGYYNQYPAGYARVTQISNVERRNNSTLRVTGYIDTGRYNQGYNRADLRFRCNVDYAGRVTNLRFNRV